MAFQAADASAKKQETVPNEKAQPEEKEASKSFSLRVLKGDTLDTSAPEPEPKKEGSMNMKVVPRNVMIGGIVAVLLLGVGTGFGVAYWNASRTAPITANQMAAPEEIENSLKVGAVFGVADEKTFRDSTEGVLIRGGLNGEGSHTLIRPGGADQNVYLTSSVVDLDQFINMKIKIAGETFKGQKAGWLMDVGRVEVESLKGEFPDWYQKEQAKMEKNNSAGEEQ